MQDARLAGIERGGMPARLKPGARRLDPTDHDLPVVQEGVKQTDSIGTAADTGHQRVRQAAQLIQTLPPRLPARDRVKIAHHGRIGMRSGDSADDIEGIINMRHPVAHGLIEGVFQGPGAGLDRRHRRAQQFHFEHIAGLSPDILGPHIDDAFHAIAGRDRGRGHAVLPGAGFGNDAPLAHAPGEQGLAHGVIDLVRAGMIQVFTLEVNLRAGQFFAPVLGMIERRGAADILF